MRFPRSEWQRPLSILALVLFCLISGLAQDSALDRAITALQNGDAATAESILRSETAAHPRDAQALGVLAVVLDQENKTAEADEIYRRAIAAGPNAAPLLNNYGNHLLRLGRTKEAKAQFLKVLTLDPAHANASTQLARLALQSKQPAEADRYLSRLTPEQQSRPDVQILQMQADYALHRTQAAAAILGKLRTAAAGNTTDLFHLAVALSGVGQYAPAEDIFAACIEQQPDNPEFLHDFGVAASHAGDDERARDALRRASAREPDSVDILYDLAAVELRLNDGEAALQSLAHAHQLAPQRADVEFALAHATAEVGYFADALQAWKAYREIAPNDPAGAREYAFCETALGQNTSEAIAELQAYVRRHPSDPIGHYELGVALLSSDTANAMRELDRALAMKPDFAAAHMARGLSESHAGDLAAAWRDFQAASTENPKSAVVLDHLGETDLQLDRVDDALAVLRRAEQLDPQNATVLLHLGRALARAGDPKSAGEVLARYRELGGAKSLRPHSAGLLEFLALSPEQQQQRYRAGVTHAYETNPDNIDAAVRYLGLMLEDGNASAAEQVCKRLAEQHPDEVQLRRAADELISAQAYELAGELLSPGTGTIPPSLVPYRAVSLLHTSGPREASAILETVPNTSRDANYAVVGFECAAVVNEVADKRMKLQGEVSSSDPTLLRDGILFLISADRVQDASMLVGAEPTALRSDPEGAALNAFVNAVIDPGKRGEFAAVERRWPDWPQVRYAHAAALYVNGEVEGCKRILEQLRLLSTQPGSLGELNAELRRSYARRSDVLRLLAGSFSGASLPE